VVQLLAPVPVFSLGPLAVARLSGFVADSRLFKMNLYEPEILTFDELLARAEWHVQLAEDQADTAVDLLSEAN
jgi:hypothetical protein